MSLFILIVAGLVLGTWTARLLRIPGGLCTLSVVSRLFSGLSLCAVAVLLTGSVSLRATGLLMGALAIGGLGVEAVIHAHKRRPHSGARSRPSSPSLIEYAAIAAIAVALGLSLIGALAPVTGWDACVAHVALPKDYAFEGRIFAFEGNEYSAYPQLLHCLFTYTYSQDGETCVSLFGWVLGLSACAAMFALGRLADGRQCGWIAAAILATAPIFIDQTGAPSLDLAFAAFTIAALACLASWQDEDHSGWLMMGGLIAGASCGIRHTGYLTCVLLAIGVLVPICYARVLPLAAWVIYWTRVRE